MKYFVALGSMVSPRRDPEPGIRCETEIGYDNRLVVGDWTFFIIFRGGMSG